MNYNMEEIGKRIKLEREKRGLSQQELGELLGEKYNDKKTGKQISIYESGKIPPLPVMLNLCKVFNCELGYLLCESDYSNTTKLYTSIERELGLQLSSIESIKRIVYGVFKKYKVKDEKALKALNCLLSSNSFDLLIKSMEYLDEVNVKKNMVFSNLEKKYGTEKFNEAWEIYHSDLDYEHDKSIISSKTITNILRDIGKEIDEQQKYEYDLKVAKYQAIESLQAIINDLY